MSEAKVKPLDALPDPQGFGSFWFGPPGSSEHPAIFLSSIGNNDQKLRYIAMRGRDGMVWDGAKLREFETPQAALKALRKLANGRGR